MTAFLKLRELQDTIQYMYLPTPYTHTHTHTHTHEKDIALGQFFLCGIYQVWIQILSSSRPVAIPRQKNSVCPTILRIAGGGILRFITFPRLLYNCSIFSDGCYLFIHKKEKTKKHLYIRRLKWQTLVPYTYYSLSEWDSTPVTSRGKITSNHKHSRI